jgi:D-alanyl-D-alanine carboxypeptidase
MPKARFATVTALLLFLLVAGATPAATAPDLAAKLDPFFDALESNGRLHGSVAVMKDGQLLYRRAVGMRAQANGSPVAADANTMYRIASITKVFTAVMIYQLIEEKKLTLDTRLSEFFPSIPNAEQITIAHLLSHSSGIGNYPPTDVAEDSDSWRFRPQTKEQMLARFAELKPDYAPGEKSTYSNTNFALLGYIIEAVTRSTYAAQLERRVNRKIGLKRTRYGGAAGSNEALSFTYDESKWTVLSTEHPTVPAGAGAIVSTPTELAKFITAVFEHRLLKPQSVTEMLTPFSKDLPGSEKGIVVFKLSDRNRTAYQHLGGIDAFSNSLTWLPDEKIAIAIMLNGQNYPMGKVFYAIVDATAGRDVEVPSFQARALPAETLARYEGTYSLPDGSMKITVRRAGDQLEAQASGQDAFPIHAIHETMFSHPPSGILIEFRKVGEGEEFSQLVLFQGRSQLRFARETNGSAK